MTVIKKGLDLPITGAPEQHVEILGPQALQGAVHAVGTAIRQQAVNERLPQIAVARQQRQYIENVGGDPVTRHRG